jgi:site-specific DNA-adenine methylase
MAGGGMKGLPPFWRYYGGKNRAAKLYPGPEYKTIIEPFAGAAGYSHLHFHRNVILFDKFPPVVGAWRYLIRATEQELLRLPDIPVGGGISDLPSWVPQEAKYLIGYWIADASTHPGATASPWANRPNIFGGWNARTKERIARNMHKIRHWQIIEGDYRDAPDIEATWFVDPPYNNRAGRKYTAQPDSFESLGEWCKGRKGQVMVCENEGADWLPFERFATLPSSKMIDGKKQTVEVLWTNKPPRVSATGQQLFNWTAR